MDWYDIAHPGQRKKAEKAEQVPVMTKLAALFAAEYGERAALKVMEDELAREYGAVD